LDSFETNKIAGGVLASAVAILGISIVSGIVYKPDPVKVKGYKVEGVEVEATASAPAEAEKPIAFYLASADPAKGEASFKKCQSCHNNAKGGPNAIGPNLWGVVGRPIGKHEGYTYSAAVSGHGGEWTWDNISAWIANPKTYIPQDKMAFAGIEKAKDRADLLAYLNRQSDKPLALPPVPADGGKGGPGAGATPSEATRAERDRARAAFVPDPKVLQCLGEQTRLRLRQARRPRCQSPTSTPRTRRSQAVMSAVPARPRSRVLPRARRRTNSVPALFAV